VPPPLLLPHLPPGPSALLLPLLPLWLC
jgi:hypothetical protein